MPSTSHEESYKRRSFAKKVADHVKNDSSGGRKLSDFCMVAIANHFHSLNDNLLITSRILARILRWIEDGV